MVYQINWYLMKDCFQYGSLDRIKLDENYENVKKYLLSKYIYLSRYIGS